MSSRASATEESEPSSATSRLAIAVSAEAYRAIRELGGARRAAPVIVHDTPAVAWGADSSTVEIDGVTFRRAERAGAGSFGDVFRYRSAAGDAVAIKFFRNRAAEEAEARVLPLLLRASACGQIPAHAVPCMGQRVVLMPSMDATLAQLAGKLGAADAAAISHAARDQALRLLSRGLFYSDMKVANVMITNLAEPCVHVSLVDFGSVVNLFEEEGDAYPITYPSPLMVNPAQVEGAWRLERFFARAWRPSCWYSSHVVWQAHVMLLNLLPGTHPVWIKALATRDAPTKRAYLDLFADRLDELRAATADGFREALMRDVLTPAAVALRLLVEHAIVTKDDVVAIVPVAHRCADP